MKIALFVAGTKGANFLRNFSAQATVALVVSYPSKGLRHDAYAEIRNICSAKGYEFRDRAGLSQQDYAAASWFC